MRKAYIYTNQTININGVPSSSAELLRYNKSQIHNRNDRLITNTNIKQDRVIYHDRY